MVKRLLVKKQEDLLSELTQEIPANGIITVGNDSSATIELRDEKIAPEQVVIVCEEGTMTLLCRVDGTAVNGEILPQGARRIEAARLSWQSGQGTLAAVLDARRTDIEQRVKRLDLQADAARHRVELLYLAGEAP